MVVAALGVSVEPQAASRSGTASRARRTGAPVVGIPDPADCDRGVPVGHPGGLARRSAVRGSRRTAGGHRSGRSVQVGTSVEGRYVEQCGAGPLAGPERKPGTEIGGAELLDQAGAVRPRAGGRTTLVLSFSILAVGLGLGARPVDVGQTGAEPFTVLADPEGNEFCLLHVGPRGG
ncbi:VOC family protein [Dactylosporangium sp. NPDC049525]|uniref:VOC family protein n=1 Tax=Dactylosporangium sp. NPDC049525 TaxID=3154730 RepID=UPI00344745F3